MVKYLYVAKITTAIFIIWTGFKFNAWGTSHVSDVI